jgi:hypothetical protein
VLVEEIEEPRPTVGGGDRLEAVRTVAHERMAVCVVRPRPSWATTTPRPVGFPGIETK